MTIDERFFSKNLLKYTDELIYVVPFDGDEPGTSEDVVSSSLKILAEQPATVYSDKVIVKSEGIRKVFIDEMVLLSGEEHREYWGRKIIEHF